MVRRAGEQQTLRCSFCGKSQQEVFKLIAGPEVFICDECVDVAREIIAEGLTVRREQELDPAGIASRASNDPVTGFATRCALCHMPIVEGDGLLVRERGIVCFGCLGEIEAALAETRTVD